MDSSAISRRDTAWAARLVVLYALVFQGWHVVEHLVQFGQREAFGVPDGNGILGSALDMAPVHFLYNLGYWLLLVAIYLGLGLHRDGARTYGRAILWLLTFAVAWQTWHMVEHVAQMLQYLAAPRPGGFPGLLGQPNGPFVGHRLHLTYNLVAYVPLVVVFFQGDFHKRAKADLRAAFVR